MGDDTSVRLEQGLLNFTNKESGIAGAPVSGHAYTFDLKKVRQVMREVVESESKIITHGLGRFQVAIGDSGRAVNPQTRLQSG